MPTGKVISMDSPRLIREKLISATGRVLAREGFLRLDQELVAREAGVGQENIRRYFQGLEGLVSAFGESGIFWPSAQELMQLTREDFSELCPEKQMAAFYKGLLASLTSRPQTLDILAWESLERNEYSRKLEEVRVRTSLEYFENLRGDIPEDLDLSAIVALLAGGVHFLAVRSRQTRSFGGIDLESEKGWDRINEAIDVLLRGSLSSEGQGLEQRIYSGRDSRS